MKKITKDKYEFERGPVEGEVEIRREDGEPVFVKTYARDDNRHDWEMDRAPDDPEDPKFVFNAEIYDRQAFREFIQELLDLID